MKKENEKLEILAPAGNLESFYCAINAGADAIYMGLQEFNARGNIENFDDEKIKEAVDYAHLFGVKVYLTFNILIKDCEMERALKTIKHAYDIGVDAFIVQDIGLAMNIKKFIPKANLHASTQMGIHNLDGAKFIESLGFSRVVLARETPIEEIKLIHQNTNLEIEFFVQGALCVAFSGNCYLCSLVNGNSGNRGKCQQFCRLPYRCENKLGKREGYLLSTKDLCMLPMLKELSDAGVMSFKIEGRARRPAYVAQCVQTYRKAIDNNFNFSKHDIEDLKKVFNRGDYSQGYLKNEKIIYPQIQGHKGIKIGRVESIKLGSKFNVIEISSTKEINVGDGLKFIKNGCELGSIGVGDVKLEKGRYKITTTSKIDNGCDVYLILDSKKEKELMSCKKRIKIDAEFIAKKNKQAELIFKYKDKRASVLSENILEESINQPLSYDTIYEQLSKLKDSPFELINLKTEVEDVFAKKSEINNMRRICVEKLIKEILKDYKRNNDNLDIEIKHQKTNINNSEKIIKIKDMSTFNEIKNDFNLIIFSPNVYSLKEINEFATYCEKSNKKGFLELPIFATEKDILFIKNILKNANTLGIVANNYYALNLCEKNKIIIGMGLNVYNNYALDFYRKNGYGKIIISKENDLNDMEDFSSGEKVFAFYEGFEEYMTFRHCPFKEFYESDCANCKYCDNTIYSMQNGKKLFLERKKIVSCQFILKSLEKTKYEILPKFGKYIEY